MAGQSGNDVGGPFFRTAGKDSLTFCRHTQPHQIFGTIRGVVLVMQGVVVAPYACLDIVWKFAGNEKFGFLSHLQ